MQSPNDTAVPGTDTTKGTFYVRAQRSQVVTGGNSCIFTIEDESGTVDRPDLVLFGDDDNAQFKSNYTQQSSAGQGTIALPTEVVDTEHGIAVAFADGDMATRLSLTQLKPYKICMCDFAWLFV